LIEEHPELVNEQPYGDGWLVIVEPSIAGQLDALMNAEGYRAFLNEGGSSH
jgi:glycine cleavage system H protein